MQLFFFKQVFRTVRLQNHKRQADMEQHFESAEKQPKEWYALTEKELHNVSLISVLIRLILVLLL
jgi:hypothetical protein